MPQDPRPHRAGREVLGYLARISPGRFRIAEQIVDLQRVLVLEHDRVQSPERGVPGMASH